MSSGASPWSDGGPRFLVAIDTASDQAGLALFDGTRVSELSWPAARAQTASLLTALQQLLELNGATIETVGAIAVASGPGSFSGLRVGIGAAKGLALGLGCPIIGIPTLDAALYPLRHLQMNRIGIAPAGRSRVVWSFATGDAPPSLPVNSTIPELIAAIDARGSILVAGELDPEHSLALARDPRFIMPAPALSHRQPAAIAALAWQRWRSGAADDLAALEPMYAGRTGPSPGS